MSYELKHDSHAYGHAVMEAPCEDNFQSFLNAHELYREAYEILQRTDEILAQSARTVFSMNGTRLGPVAGEILEFAGAHYGSDCISAYVKRVRSLNELQARFDAEPSVETLGDEKAPLDRDQYDISLLLSIVFCNHRFEIFSRLREYLDFIGRPQGRMAAVGMGTGYEMVLAARRLRRWRIEGYDTDAQCRATARAALSYFNVGTPVVFGERFPLEKPERSFIGQYDGIVCCELMEHLRNPLSALRTLREYMSETGSLFVTMAVRIAQEDHVYLYEDLDSCRDQLKEAGLKSLVEIVVPVSVRPFAEGERRSRFRRGNFVAIVRPS